MNESEIYLKAVKEYAAEVEAAYKTGHAKEHGYRPALERLMSGFKDCKAINDPKRSEHGNPDFIFLKESNIDIILGYGEAKDIDVPLDKTEKTNQMLRYSGYDNLFLTNYLEFRFYQNGNKYQTITIGELKDGNLSLEPENYRLLADGLHDFLELEPETIKSGKRLAEIMGAKARRIRDNVVLILKNEEVDSNKELEKIYKMIQALLVHDLTIEKFADMYAQTLVYGLFVARYGDTTPDSFTRQEARDLVPKSNPFLQKFFDHIVGPDFVTSLSRIVDELCEVFSASDVHMIVHKHLRILEETGDKDPIIHFYEDFLKEYDPLERKRMGAYYTPIPIVQFIIRHVDEILKRDFGLTEGLADTAKKSLGTFKNTNKKTYHRVQVLDPAVGTATFLNEMIKYIYKQFEGQEGRWQSYVEQDLVPRLFGFELMMAPYTIAHLKLGMTLQESGVKDLNERLNIYLTNTLEEGIKSQQDIFTSIGLAEAVSEEGIQAGVVKEERPIMVIVGNPPYSISSANKSVFITNLLKAYKSGLNERKLNLDDDYIKFIRFSDDMISKNGEGIVAMITNNSFIDGVTHRQMRKHLLDTFNDIYILDLHGNSKKKEVSPDGGKDENVFDIQQGVSINIFVRKPKKNSLGNVYHSELFGKRKEKFEMLEKEPKWTKLKPIDPYYFFVPKDFSLEAKYQSFVKMTDLFSKYSAGIKTKVDHIAVSIDKETLAKRLENITTNNLSIEQIKAVYGLNDNSTWEYKPELNMVYNPALVAEYEYRPFDIRYTYFDSNFLSRPRNEIMSNFFNKDNIGLELSRNGDYVFIGNKISDEHYISGNSFKFPLYLYQGETRLPNFDEETLGKFTKNLSINYKPEDILDYIYSVLFSPKYREEYNEFLKIDFPRVPVPKSDKAFKKYIKLGHELRELHLMISPLLKDLETTYPNKGDDEVEKITFKEGKVQINGSQYFGNVPEVAWHFFIGSIQPAQKWLKDRKGRKLTNEDIVHYQKIIKVLIETDKIMKEIDKIKGM